MIDIEGSMYRKPNRSMIDTEGSMYRKHNRSIPYLFVPLSKSKDESFLKVAEHILSFLNQRNGYSSTFPHGPHIVL